MSRCTRVFETRNVMDVTMREHGYLPSVRKCAPIFFSYRRHNAEAGRQFDDLVEQFGEQSVFMDVSARRSQCERRSFSTGGY